MSDSARSESRGNRGNNSRSGGYNRNDRGSSKGSRKFGDRDGKKFSDRKKSGGSFKRDDRKNKDGSYQGRDGQKFGDKKFADRKNGGRSFNRDDRRDDRKNGERKFNDRNSGGRRYNKENRPAGGHQRGGQKRREERFATENVKAGYRPSHGAGPEFDTDVTGKELDNFVQRQLRALEMQNAEVVAKHLVMASRYLELDPKFALEHAQAAVKRAGRIAAVREAAGIAAYVAEDYEMALRELRTHRRITGSNDHYAILMDCERALDRIDKALSLAEDAQHEELDAATRVEVALVVSGIKHDQGNLKGAIAALEIPELNAKRGYEYSPRLFEAYADLLDEAGRSQEASRWMRLAVITEAALGQGDFAEPEIFDIFGEAELFEPEEKSIDLEGAEKVIEPGLEAQEDNSSVATESSREEESAAESSEQDAAEPAEASDVEENEKAHEITEDSSVDDDIELEADVQEALNYTYSEENVQEDLLSIIEENEKDNQ